MKDILICNIKKIVLLLLIFEIIVLSLNFSLAQNTNDTDREKYQISVNWDPYGKGDVEYYPNYQILLYANFSISGGSTKLERGGYIKLTIPRAQFSFPKNDDVSRAEKITDVNISSDSNNYYVKIYTDIMYAGTSIGIPFKLRFASNSVKDKDKHNVKIELFNKYNKMLSENNFKITSKAKVPRLTDWTRSPIILKEKPINGKIKPQIEKFIILAGSYEDELDIRKSKLVVEMPYGLVPNTSDWKKVPNEDNKYERIFSNAYTDEFVSADLSKIDYYTENMPIEIKYTKYIQKLDNPSEWELVNSASFKQKILLPPTKPIVPEIPKKVVVTLGVDNRLLNEKLEIIRDLDYNVSLPYNKEELKKHYIAQHHKFTVPIMIGNIFINSKDFSDDSLKYVIKEIRFIVPKYNNPYGFRFIDAMPNIDLPEGITITGEVVGEEGKYELINSPLIIKTDNLTKEGITGNKLIQYRVNEAKKSKDWQYVTVRDYKAFTIKFPGDGLVLEGKEKIHEFTEGFFVENINRVDDNVYKVFEKEIENLRNPNILCYYNAKDNEKHTIIKSEITFHSSKDKVVTQEQGAIVNNLLYLKINYLKTNGVNLKVKRQKDNGDWYYTNTKEDRNFYVQKIMDLEIVEHFSADGYIYDLEPKNLVYYYLIPFGLKPINDQPDLKEIVIKPSNKEGYQLVSAKLKKDIEFNPPTPHGTRQKYTSPKLRLEVMKWAKSGEYNVYGAVLMDNNKLTYLNGRANGYQMNHKINSSSPFYGIHQEGENNPVSSEYFDYAGSQTIILSPPKHIIGVTKVKLADEPDNAYFSITGKKFRKDSEETIIKYRHEFKNETFNRIDQLTFLNILPKVDDYAPTPDKYGVYKPRGSKFSTPLVKGAESEYFDFYYSIEPPVNNIAANLLKTFIKDTDTVNWTEEDWSKVTMIKGVLKENKKILENQTIYVVTTNKVPKLDKYKQKDYAANSMAYVTGKDIIDENAYVEGYEARVNLFFPKHDVKIKKIDSETKEGLLNVGFKIYKKGSSEAIFRELFTNSNGELIFSGLEVDETYILEESTVPIGYKQLNKKIEFTVTDTKVLVNGIEEEYIEIENQRLDMFLTISKTVSGNLGDKTKYFNFKIMITENGNPINGTYEALDKDNNSLYVQFVYGTAKISLKDKESLTIKGLPRKYTYIIEEENANDYNTKINNIDSNDKKITDTCDNNTEVKISFENIRNGDIVTGLKKTKSYLLLSISIIIIILIIYKRKVLKI